MPEVKILIADDHEIVRRGLCKLIADQPAWRVVGEARDGREAVQKAAALRPEIVVLDIAMPTLNGLEATKQILKNDPRTKILILTMHESDQMIRQILAAGARGYVLKSDAGRDLVTAIETLRRNKTFLTSWIGQMVLDGYLNRRAQPEQDFESGRLTMRQREVVQLLAEGKSSKEVAGVLGMSVKTAETHRANIMKRLSCSCVSELVRYAIRNHIIEA